MNNNLLFPIIFSDLFLPKTKNQKHKFGYTYQIKKLNNERTIPKLENNVT